MVVYIDVLLLENFIVNTFLLSITARTVSTRVRGPYTYVAGFIGSLYIFTILIDSLKYFNNILMNITIAVIMVFITFRKKDLLFNIKASIIFILYSMLLAGLCIFIEFNQNNSSVSQGVIYNFSYKKLMLSVIIIYLLIDRAVLFVKDRREMHSFIYEVDIILKTSKKEIKAFLDTGNELVEPVTNLPVIIVEKHIFKEEDIQGYDIFYIPYAVINGSYGKLKAIKPECVKIHREDYMEERDVLVAFCEKKLSNSGDYQALLSRGII